MSLRQIAVNGRKVWQARVALGGLTTRRAEPFCEQGYGSDRDEAPLRRRRERSWKVT